MGITGTLGKTSTALLVQSALAAAGARVGVIGSLGVRVQGRVADTGMTTPDAPAIHRALRRMVDAGVTTAVIEVTSHGIALRRVAGLTFALGALTNLVPDEHLDFHGTAAHYLRTKARFFDMLDDGAPLVVNHDDPRVRTMVAEAAVASRRPVVTVSAGGDMDAAATVTGLRSDAAGSAFALEIRRALPRMDGSVLDPCVVPLVLPVLGVHQVANAALAAVVTLLAGGTPTAVTESVAEQAPIRRRLEIVRETDPVVLDDTVGNPQSVDAVFETIRAIPHRALRIVFGIRGSRGPGINRRLAACARGRPARCRSAGAAGRHLQRRHGRAEGRRGARGTGGDARGAAGGGGRVRLRGHAGGGGAAGAGRHGRGRPGVAARRAGDGRGGGDGAVAHRNFIPSVARDLAGVPEPGHKVPRSARDEVICATPASPPPRRRTR